MRERKSERAREWENERKRRDWLGQGTSKWKLSQKEGLKGAEINEGQINL